jgi:hypothetical protein
MTYPNLRTWHAGTGTVSDGHVLVVRIPFGQTPSLRPLRRRSPGFVRGLRRYYGPVRLPMSVHHRRMSLDFPTRPATPSAAGEPRISQFSREVFPYMHGGSDRAGSPGVSRYRCPGCGLPSLLTASAPRSKFLSRLNTRPARTPVNASPLPLRAAPHDSGPLWAANPSTYDSFLHNNLAGLSRHTESTT